MRKLTLALTALACMTAGAHAQQQPTSTVDQGKPGVAPWPISWTGQSVSADLRVGGAAVAAGNPVPTSTASLPLPAGAATSANQAAEIAALGAPADTAFAGTGSASLVAALKGVYTLLSPPTNITKTQTALTASTSTTIAAANTARVAMAIQCGSTTNSGGSVSIDETGAALTAAGEGNGTAFLPTNHASYIPPVASRTAVTAYSTIAQTCTVTEYSR